MSKFKDLGLIDALVQAVEQQGYKEPTPIQQQAVPIVLKGKDLLGCAQTGTGKTAAFALPILQNLFVSRKQRQPQKPRTLILTPTRELAVQIDENFKGYGQFLKLRTDVIFGGVGQGAQVRSLKLGLDVLVATPGRLLDLMNQKEIFLDQLEIFVLDEADRMLDMGFIHDIKKIISFLPQKRQTLFFSATMPHDILKLSSQLLKEPLKVTVNPVSTTAEKISQWVLYVEKENKKNLLKHLLNDPDYQKVIVFTRTKHGANKVVEILQKAGVKSSAIHGNKSQNARQAALDSLKQGKVRVLVATDIVARGIDIDDISHVINYEIPNLPESYVHRIGRTARAGQEGVAVSFCELEEKAYIKAIETTTKQKIPVAKDHPYHSQTIEQATYSASLTAGKEQNQERMSKKNFFKKHTGRKQGNSPYARNQRKKR